MDKSPHQLARTMSTSSEEFRKFVNRLLYEDTSNIKLSKSPNINTSTTQTTKAMLRIKYNQLI